MRGLSLWTEPPPSTGVREAYRRRVLKRLTGFMAVLLLGIVTVAAVFVGGMRAKWPPVVDTVRRTHRAVFNPEQMKSAGTPGAFASVIRHTGGFAVGETSTRS